MSASFIEGWAFEQVLGEGAFGDVKLLFHKRNGWSCAMKEIDLCKHPDAAEMAKKESTIHKLAKHEHIVECYGSRTEGKLYYIFLEYCRGGELFDRIEPEVGMPEFWAQHFFRQLISAVEYLHSIGITHRDIKPENLLLNEHDTLKLSDFGMATVYRHLGKERLLERRCGTLPYMAPEILISRYNAEPADIWSCGIVLVAMLTGELPWDKPSSDQVDYLNWKDLGYNSGLWKKVENLPLSLLRRVLMPLPSRRYTIPQIKNHIWVRKEMRETDSRPKYSEDEKRLCSDPEADLRASSQPTFNSNNAVSQSPARFCGFSQPVQMDQLLLCSQVGGTQSSQNPQQRLVRRMTRLLLPAMDRAELRAVLDSLGYVCKPTASGLLTVSTLDKRGMELVFKARIVELEEGRVLLDFRLSRGDGLEFKKNFVKIRRSMEHLVLKETW